ncbi:hypothetical protein [Fundidesulfovibrio putealis]|uniref:hypothetical protein n=1 Tax=Fundidesulfovibrio putealis TaxID=270496 RepID=UPI0003F824D5|nr:hypothetical protein [Fundidesulfovibrio putealis]
MIYILLHDPNNAASRILMAELGGEPAGTDVNIIYDGREVRVISKHTLAVAACPNFSAYPAIVVQDGEIVRVKSPVVSWADCLDFIDNPPAPSIPTPKIEHTKLEFLALFTDEEKIRLKALEATDPTVGLFWEEYRTADSIRLDDPRTVRAVEYLAAQGYITAARKAAILGL